MNLIWTPNAWDDYLWWQKYDRKILKKINILIKEIVRHPYEGIGKPEPLRYEYSGWWSRRISSEHRLIYKVENNAIAILACRYHYD